VLEVGLGWLGGSPAGTQNANLTAPDGTPFLLFSTDNTIGPGVGPEVRLGLRLTPRLAVEASGEWSRADLRSATSGDFEGASPVTASDRMTVFTVEGAVLWSFARHGKLEPFLRGEVGWRRELTSDSALAGTATIAGGGGGVKYWWREHDRGAFKRIGLRSDVRLVGHHGGLAFGTGRRAASPAASVGLMIGF
jgi:hypothetical protein